MITFSFTVARPSVTVKADGALPPGITVLTGQSGSGKSTFTYNHKYFLFTRESRNKKHDI